MEDLIKEIRLQIHERTSSPLLGSFLVSWVIWNYKFIVILFSDASITTTFSLIQQVAFPDWWSVVGLGVLGPLATAAAYIFVYPIPAKIAYEFSLKRQKEIAEIRQQIEDDTPLTNAQYRQIRHNMSSQVEEHYKEIERKDYEISKLKSEIESLKKSESETTTIRRIMYSDRPESQVSDSQIRAIELIADNGGFYPNAMLAQFDTDQRLKYEYDLGELVQKGLVATTTQGGKYGYKLTHDGKGLLLKLRGKDA